MAVSLAVSEIFSVN